MYIAIGKESVGDKAYYYGCTPVLVAVPVIKDATIIVATSCEPPVL